MKLISQNEGDQLSALAPKANLKKTKCSPPKTPSSPALS